MSRLLGDASTTYLRLHLHHKIGEMFNLVNTRHEYILTAIVIAPIRRKEQTHNKGRHQINSAKSTPS